ncbi:MAG: sulfatase-like hydrolase/transferase, partial [Acidimicrobiales bacterium]
LPDRATVSGGWPRRSWRELAVDAAVLFGLAGVAVTQPLLDLFGENPTFFVAGGYGRRQIVTFSAVIAGVPALVVWLVTALPGLVHKHAGPVFHGLGVAALGTLFGLLSSRTWGIEGVVTTFALAVAIGLGVSFAEWRWRPVRQFLGLLAAGNLAFLVLFLVASPTSELLRGASYSDAGTVHIPPLAGPVTIVVLDEFPLASIVRPDGTINEVRFPNLASLAAESTWFRNASTESVLTPDSVPSILTGLVHDSDDNPILSDHPRNYFTLFGQSYSIHRYERITDLCPPDACGRPPAQPLAQALDDAKVVYEHRVLPARLRARLPAIDHAWGQFAGDIAETSTPDTALSPEATGNRYHRLRDVSAVDDSKRGQLNALVRQARLIDYNPSINFIHVLAPHVPYVLTPWGTTAIDTWDQKEMPQPGEPGYERIFAERYALQAMQIGVVDQAIGEVVDHLKRMGAWESGSFVLISDHGMTTSAPDQPGQAAQAGSGRELTDKTQDDLLRVPLFIKAPGQTEGQVRDDPASTIDVLPSLIDLLDIEADWTFDGHSLFDGSEPSVDRLLTSELDDFYDHVARQQQAFPYGEDWVAMAAIGALGDLVGTPVSDHSVKGSSELSWSLDRRAALDDPSSTNGKVPVLITGTVSGATGEPSDLVVAIDEQIAGTIGAYRQQGGAWRFSGILGPPGARGEGEQVVAYEVDRSGADVVLHPWPSVSAAGRGNRQHKLCESLSPDGSTG